MFNRVMFAVFFVWQMLAVVGGFGTGDVLLGSFASVGALAVLGIIAFGGRDSVKDLLTLKDLTVAQARPLIRYNVLFLVLTLSLLGQGILFGTAWYWFLIYPVLWLISGREIWIARGVLKSAKRTEVLRAKLDRGESLVEKPRPWVSPPTLPPPPASSTK